MGARSFLYDQIHTSFALSSMIPKPAWPMAPGAKPSDFTGYLSICVAE
jgi:hypothetical protein